MMEMLKGTVTPRDWAICGGIIAVAVALAALFYFVPYTMSSNALEAVRADEKAKTTDLNKAKDIEKNIEALRVEARKMDQLVTQFQMRLPENREIPALLEKFEEYAAEIGLRVEMAQKQVEEDPKKFMIAHSVKARGSFHQIASFINRLERSQRYLKVSEMNIGKEQDGVAEASFTLSTYIFKQQPTESAKS